MVSELSWVRDFLGSLIRGMDPRKIPCICVWAKLLQLCLTLCNPVDCSLRVSSVHGVHQAKILGWVSMRPPPGDLPNLGIEPAFLASPALAGRFFTTSTTWPTPTMYIFNPIFVYRSSEIFLERW